MAKLTKQKAIAKYCKECSGDSSKEVTFCSILDCPLWEYRCGYHISSNSYRPRIKRAFEKYKLDVVELKHMGLSMSDYLKDVTR